MYLVYLSFDLIMAQVAIINSQFPVFFSVLFFYDTVVYGMCGDASYVLFGVCTAVFRCQVAWLQTSETVKYSECMVSAKVLFACYT